MKSTGQSCQKLAIIDTIKYFETRMNTGFGELFSTDCRSRHFANKPCLPDRETDLKLGSRECCEMFLENFNEVEKSVR
jgi:hypothetical protein